MKNPSTPLMPDFLIIGAGKSGTTSLDNYLKQHPGIFITPVKEPNFFALEGENATPQSDDAEQMFHYPWSVTTLEGYHALFADAKPGQLKGETSPMYMYHEGAPQRIRQYIPNVKLIAILRQPAERIFSRYMHLAQENRLPSKRIEDMFDRESIWWKRNDLVREGFYFQHLSRYFQLFPRENILVLLYDDLVTNREKVMTRIFNFLEVPSDVQLDFSPEYNPSGFIKNRFLDRLIGKQSVILQAISKVAPSLYTKTKNSPALARVLNKLRKKNLDKPVFDPGLRDRITQEIYREDLVSLQALLSLDLSKWLQPSKR